MTKRFSGDEIRMESADAFDSDYVDTRIPWTWCIRDRPGVGQIVSEMHSYDVVNIGDRPGESVWMLFMSNSLTTHVKKIRTNTLTLTCRGTLSKNSCIPLFF